MPLAELDHLKGSIMSGSSGRSFNILSHQTTTGLLLSDFSGAVDYLIGLRMLQDREFRIYGLSIFAGGD